MCGVLKFTARANAGQCELSEGTGGELSKAVGAALAAAAAPPGDLPGAGPPAPAQGHGAA